MSFGHSRGLWLSFHVLWDMWMQKHGSLISFFSSCMSKIAQYVFEVYECCFGTFLSMKWLKVDEFMVLDVYEWPDLCLGVTVLRGQGISWQKRKHMENVGRTPSYAPHSESQPRHFNDPNCTPRIGCGTPSVLVGLLTFVDLDPWSRFRVLEHEKGKMVLFP